jgi:glutamate-ammonia-ligase adenylyltransferase
MNTRRDSGRLPGDDAAAAAVTALLGGKSARFSEIMRSLGFSDSPAAERHLPPLAGRADPRKRPAFLARTVAALAAGPDPDGGLVRLARFDEASFDQPVAGLHPDSLDRLCRLLSFSPFLGGLLIRFPEWANWLDKDADLAASRTAETIGQILREAAESETGEERRRLAALRMARRELLRLGARRILDFGDETAMTAELSALAAATLCLALDEVERPLAARFGQPIEEGSEETMAGPREARFCVLAMGKLGGGELNFSSDIDLMFVYSGEGTTTGRHDGTGRVSNHLYYTRLAEALIQYLAAVSEEGFFYRVDTRLRPDGESGPLVRSFDACEIYYTTQAHVWERLALLKARGIAGNARLADRFEAMARPLIFNPLHGDLLPSHIRELKRKIDAEVARKQTADREVKRGAGGIREIEFLVQTLQMLHGARQPELAVPGTLEAIALLDRRGLLPSEQAERLAADYRLLRTIEHRLQMMQLRQTHLLPSEPAVLDALARRCGIEAEGSRRPGDVLMERWRAIAVRVHRDFIEFFGADEEGASVLSIDEAADAAERAAAAVLSDLPQARVMPLLEPLDLAHGGVLKTLRQLGGLGRELYLGESGRESYRRLLPALLRDLSVTPQPESALSHLDSLLHASGALGSYYDVFLQTPASLTLLVRAFGSGNDLAQTLVAHPEFIDYLSEPARLSGPPDREAMRARLDRWLASAREPVESSAALARLKRFEYLLTELGEIGDLLDYTAACARMCAAAETILAAALKTASTSLNVSGSGFAILTLGKLGAGELNYHSDLDLIFAWDETFDPGRKPPGEAAAELAERVMELLTTATPEGRPYEVDARLRPEGSSAPLAPPLSRYIEYFQGGRAQVWEFQSMMQLRPVAGDPALGERLRAELGSIIAGRVGALDLRRDIRSMRRRIEESVKLPRWVFCDFKKGAGGTVDLEFIAQYLQLVNLSRDPRLIGLGPLGALERLAGNEAVEHEWGERIIDRYTWLRRLERRTRRLLGSDRSAIPNSGEKLAALERACAALLDPGEELKDRVGRIMRGNRKLFQQILGGD